MVMANKLPLTTIRMYIAAIFHKNDWWCGLNARSCIKRATVIFKKDLLENRELKTLPCGYTW